MDHGAVEVRAARSGEVACGDDPDRARHPNALVCRVRRERLADVADELGGAVFSIKDLEGKMTEVDLRGKVISPKGRKILEGKGLGRDGRLIITFDIKFPRKLDDGQIAAIRGALQK